MIQQMNKYAFLIYHREYEEFLSYLQGLGVVHISQRVKPQEAKELQAITEERVQIKSLLKHLKPWLEEDVSLPQVDQYDADILAIATDVLRGLELHQQAVERAEDALSERRPWGEYDPNILEALRKEGYPLVGYVLPTTQYTEEYAEEYAAISICRDGLKQYFVRLEVTDLEPCVGAERCELPFTTIADLEKEKLFAQEQLAQYEKELRLAAPRLSTMLLARDTALEDRFSFGAARLQGEPQAEETLMFLEGWIPSHQVSALEQALSHTGYYYKQCQIDESDRVPISLKNNVFARGFELLTRLYSLPNYNEIDPTLLFAPFFMLFFGLCLGDAGYGLLIFVVSAYLYLKHRSSGDTGAYELMMWLGAAGTVIGLLLGSLFGVVLPYAEGKDYFLNQDNQMILSVIIGFVQIFFAKGVAAYKIKKQQGLKYALAPFAWIFFLLSLIAVLALPALGITLSSPIRYVLYAIVGVTALPILFYNTPGESPLMNIGFALWAAYNNASGLLGDTLSYIRLFAIGLTGAVLGSVFNTLAIDQTEGLNVFLRFPLMLFVLIIGHSINIGLAMIGALVHPIRLTFVEYFKNSEYEGGGIPYSPLKNILTEQSKNK